MQRFLLIIFLLISAGLFAQQRRFVEFSVEHGLAQSQVSSILQDNDGYLWIGTQGGLSKFDGVEFVNYSTVDGLVGNSIVSLRINNNDLWICANGGVSVLNSENKFENYSFDGEFAGVSASDVMFYNGNTYVSTNGEGLFLLSNNKLKHIDNIEGIHPRIRSMVNYKGRLYLGTQGGLLKLHQGAVETVDSVTSRLSISSIKVHGDSLIGGTYGEGIFIKYKDSISFLKHSDNTFNRIREVYVSKTGEIWGATKYGVIKYTGNDTELLIEENGLPTENIYCVFEDSEMNIWLGTSGNGIQKFTSYSFIYYSTQSGLVSNKVMAITKDYRNNYWIGTIDKGACYFDGNIFKTLKDNNRLAPTVRCFLSEKNRLLIGTYKGVFEMYYNDRGEPELNRCKSFEKLNNERVTTIAKFNEFYWVGTNRDIWLFNQDTAYNLNPNQYGYSGQIRQFASFNDEIFIATSTGYYNFQNNAFKKIDLPNNINKEINCFKFLKDGRAVLGSSNGVYIGKNGKFEKINLGRSFNENIINFIQIDPHENIFFGTNNGLFVLKNDKFGYAQTMPIKFSTSHGLNSVETNLGSSFIDDENNIWFGTIAGMVKQADPELLIQEQFTPRLHLSNIKVFSESFDWKKLGYEVNHFGLPKNLELKSNQNYITFDFIGLYFKDPENVIYQYQLEGVDEVWSPVSKSSNVTYPGLSSGNYTFKVRAKYGRGEWSEIQSFSFNVKAPFYKTWWFFLIVVLVILLIVFAYFQYRLSVFKRKKETEKLMLQGKLLSLEQRSLNASMNRHFIFNSLNSIQYFINMKDRVSANKYLTNFAKLIRKNLDSSTSDDNKVTLEDEIERLKLYLSLEMMRFQGKFDYEIIVKGDVDLEHIRIPSMILQPFVENSIIHGILPKKDPNGMIKITIEDEGNDYVVIEILDNGIGIENSRSQKSQSEGDHISQGMKITQSRVEILKSLSNKKMLLVGPKQIVNNDGSIYGTHVLIKIPT